MRYFAGLLLLCILFPFQLVQAESVEIRGSFPGAAGEEVRIMAYADFVSRRPVELGAATIDDSGSFHISLDIGQSQPVILRILHGRYMVFLEPGASYFLRFDPDNLTSLPEGRGPHPITTVIPFESERLDGEDDINDFMGILEDMIFDYLDQHVFRNIRANHASSLERFAEEVNEQFALVSSTFFQTIIRYELAMLQHSLNVKRFAPLAGEYLLDHPILYHHPAYMDFLVAMFDSYLFSGSIVKMHQLEDAVNTQTSLSALGEVLAQDPVLGDGRMRELVMLMGLQRMLSMQSFASSKVVLLLEEASVNAEFSEHRAMAENILHQFRHLRKGYPLPEFNLKSEIGEKYSRDGLKRKPLLVFFWADWCPVAAVEIDPVLALYDAYKDDLQFLCVLVDRDKNASQRLIDRIQPPFPMVHFDGDYRLLDRFGLRQLPLYVLIDSAGNIMAYPLPAQTSREGREVLDRLLR